ncbi:MAG: CopG family transcriptional regulator [Nitrospirae bacterium]|nr:CopG family transcriptional regulator [Nitrospirota bacterium]
MKTTLTIRDDLSKRLERLSKSTKRTKSSLASEAIEEFLTVQEWHIQAIKEGIAAANAGKIVSHKEAIAELKKWGRRAS